MNFSYKFSAVAGMQANREYYIAMIPLKYLDKLFSSDNEILLPEDRAQRKLNFTRIPEISEYILNNRQSYVFSALSASIDGLYAFEYIDENKNLGILEIDMAAKLIINDGQHRKAAIISALQDDPSLGEESISIVFFEDIGLERSQQMFADLNKHAVKPSKSLSALYDYRDANACIARYIVDKVSFFNRFTELETDTLGVNSPKFFTLDHLNDATSRILKGSDLLNEDRDFALMFWQTLVLNISEWKQFDNKEITKRYLKENYIITLGVVLKALGLVGHYFYKNRNVDIKETLSKLQEIDWLRSSKQWKGRTIREDGKVMSSEQAIILTANKIKELICLPLSREELDKEKFLSSKKK